MRDRNTSADALQLVAPFLLGLLLALAVAQAVTDGAGCSCRASVRVKSTPTSDAGAR